MVLDEADRALAEALVAVLEQCRTRGPYPCPEAELKKGAAARLVGRAPRKGLAGRLGRLVAQVAVKDRARKGRPVACVLSGDEALLYAVGDEELVEAVRSLRRDRGSYPASVPGLARVLGLTPAGRKFLQERIVSGRLPEGLGRAPGRSPQVALQGEEGFGKALSRKEQLDLRIRLADLERPLAARRQPDRAVPEAAESFESLFGRAYEALALSERSPFVPLPLLRAALSGWPRERFDQGLIGLCRADRFQLAEHEHPARLSPEERAESLFWGAERRAFYYVSKI